MAAPTATAGGEKRKWRVTVLISGSGSNLQALLDALPTSLSSSLVVSVLSNKPSAFGLQRAASHSPPIPSSSLSLKQFRESQDLPIPADADKATTRAAYELAFSEKVRRTRPDLVVLAGWMLVLSAATLDALVRDWDEIDEWSITEAEGGLRTPGQSPYAKDPTRGTPIPIINLHPALPGTFPGAHAIKDAWDAFTTPIEGRPKIVNTGIMVHRVIPELDAGEPVIVKEIEMVAGEPLEKLEERIHAVEHEGIVEAVAKATEQLGDGSWWR